MGSAVIAIACFGDPKIPREAVIGEYGAGEPYGLHELKLYEDGNYAYRFTSKTDAEFTWSGRWDFDTQGTRNVVILRAFSSKIEGAPPEKRDWRFVVEEDSGLYRFLIQDPRFQTSHPPSFERPVK